MAADRSAAVQIDGLKPLARNLKKVDAALPKEMRQINLRLAEPIATAARSRAPSRTGRLAASIRPNATPTTASVSSGSRLPYPYAPIVHYGGYPGDYAGQPFLTDVLSSVSSEVADNYSEEIDRFLSAGVGRYLMAEIGVRLDHPDGTTEEVLLDVSLESLTMREAARLEEVLGSEAFAQLTSTGITPSPRVIQAVIYVKLRNTHPEVTLDGFDLSLEELQEAFETEEEEEPHPLSVASGGGSNG